MLLLSVTAINRVYARPEASPGMWTSRERAMQGAASLHGAFGEDDRWREWPHRPLEFYTLRQIAVKEYKTIVEKMCCNG